MAIAAARLGPIASNTPLDPAWVLGADLLAPAHLMIDFGDDRLTAGRPHPMIDQTLRLERIAAEAADPSCAVLLLDVVLGYGANADPAYELARQSPTRAKPQGAPGATSPSSCRSAVRAVILKVATRPPRRSPPPARACIFPTRRQPGQR